MQLQEIISHFNTKKVLVVGDVMLDASIWADNARISPEAPVQIIDVMRETFVPGGAANVAAGILALGASVRLTGVIGKDKGGAQLASALTALGLDASRLVEEKERETTVKTRIFLKDQQILRYDREKRTPISTSARAEILELLKQDINWADAVIVSDYAKGVVSEELMAVLIPACKEKNVPVIVDPKPIHTALYLGVALITPNHREARAMRGLSQGSGDLKEIEEDGRELLQMLGCAVLITRGKDGMSLFMEGRDPFHLSALAHEVRDITGAGDTVTAAMALALASGSTLPDAVAIANHAAALTVQKEGTSTVPFEELRQSISGI